MRRTMRRQCPHCTNYVTWPETLTYPFCSERCRLIDLGVWADGGYRLPGDPASAADLQGHTTTSEDEELSAEG